MSKSLYASGALALALLSPSVHAASDADLDEIRAQIRELKASYEARIQALEQRLKDAEAKAAQSSAAPVAPPAMAAAPEPASMPAGGGSAPSSLAAFNPAVSAVLQGRYANLSQSPSNFAIAGFAPGGDIGPGRRGFSLAESELALSANVDHKFAGNLIFSLSPDNTVSVEEAYGIFTAAPYGIVPKVGRFFSGIGYQNEQHQHAWDFIDAPLAYQAFLGGQYSQDGMQVKWVAPIDHYVELGAEIGNGDAFPGTPRDKNGVGSSAVYVHTGGDIGDSHSWRAGLSYLATRAEARPFSTDPTDDTSFTGRSRLAIADFVWKWSPNGNPRERNFKLQGEYLRRTEKGDTTSASLPIGDTSYSSRQSGWDLQGIYQFMPMWRVGARYDRLDPGSVDTGVPGLASSGFAPKRSSVMLDWSPSEFSRVRLQLAQSKTQPGITDNELFVQYILSLGAHGAHKY